MFKNGRSAVLFAIPMLIGFSAVRAQDGASLKDGQTLHIDIPVTLENANVVFDVGHGRVASNWRMENRVDNERLDP